MGRGREREEGDMQSSDTAIAFQVVITTVSKAVF